MKVKIIAVLFLSALALSACGSSGGTSTPPPPPAPVAPPPPPPEPTFEERLADWAAMDPNPCRARTPGFEALGGWLKDDGREVGKSRVWISDTGALDAPLGTHGRSVWATLTACAVRSDEDQYFDDGIPDFANVYQAALDADGRDLLESISRAPAWADVPFPAPRPYRPDTDGMRDGQRVMNIAGAGNTQNLRTSSLQYDQFQYALEHVDSALWIVVGGYTGEGDNRAPASSSSICGAADPLCLFAPWQGAGDASNEQGTSFSAPQVAAALDTVWAVWPDMDILDLRNLAFDCAENMDAPEGETATTRSYSYKNGRSFTSDTNSTWGHGILSMTCLFTPNGGLQNPVTGNAVSGGIFGPMAGPITGASITGVDYTGRDFGYGFAHPVARENHALAATANLSAVQPFSGHYASTYVPGAFRGKLWQRGAVSVDLTASGNAIGAVAQWQVGNIIVQSGIATQPEGAGSLIGSRAFRAPSTVSAAITAAYGKVLPNGLSAHVQADHWRTLATHGRSLWENARLNESRLSAALVKRVGQHEFALQGVWRSGLSGSLDVDGRSWALSPRAESGVWLTWRRELAR